jgi:hypothetical protein
LVPEEGVSQANYWDHVGAAREAVLGSDSKRNRAGSAVGNISIVER